MYIYHTEVRLEPGLKLVITLLDQDKQEIKSGIKDAVVEYSGGRYVVCVPIDPTLDKARLLRLVTDGGKWAHSEWMVKKNFATIPESALGKGQGGPPEKPPKGGK